ncbi:hypothetical protein Tco_1217646 [Tanacetum coccineum]
MNLGKKDVDMTEAEQGEADQHNVSYRSGFEQEEEDDHVTLTTVHDKIEVTTTVPALLDFASIFRFNDRVTNLERDLSELKQVDQYAQAIASIPAIVDRYMDNKLVEAIHKAIQSHIAECREEAQAEKQEYIDNVDSTVRTIIREEVKTQLPKILPKAVSDFATPVIKRNVTKSLEATVLARSSSQPKSNYEAVASLSEYELTKILLDKIEESKSHLRVDYKKELYDALVKSYKTNKDLFNTYGEVFTLKRSRDDKDKDQDPSAGSDRGTKRKKSSKEAELSRDSRSKEKKSSRTSKDASHSQHKPSSKSAHAEEPSHTFNESRVQQDQEFDTSNNDEQPTDKEVFKADRFKKPKRAPTPDSDWNKRQHVDFRPPQTWISQVARAKEPRTSFDELMDTSFDFSAFVLNRLNINDLTQEILVGLIFELLKGTYKSLTELEYHLEECSKAKTEQLDWHNPEGKSYPFDLSKLIPLIPDHRGRQVIPKDYFINNDLEYLKGGSLSRQYLMFVTKIKVVTYEIKWIEDLVSNLWSPMKVVYDKHAYWGTSHWVTRLMIMKMYDYGHLEEIKVRREDQKLYKFKEGNFPRFRLQDIEDKLLLLVQQKLTNLTIEERYDLNVALRMFTRWIVIQRRVEDLQLGVESYQKKLNLTKPDTFKSNLKNRTANTAYSDPKGVIYKDQNNKNILIRTDELHKFNDGTLNDV